MLILSALLVGTRTRMTNWILKEGAGGFMILQQQWWLADLQKSPLG